MIKRQIEVDRRYTAKTCVLLFLWILVISTPSIIGIIYGNRVVGISDIILTIGAMCTLYGIFILW